jgi:hypothetical protein
MRFRSDRERLEYEKFIEEDRREQEVIAARLEAPLKLKALEEEMNQTVRKLQQTKRHQALGYEEQPYISPELQNITMPMDETQAFNKREAVAFMNETPEWEAYATKENGQILASYFTNRGIVIVDRKMLKAAFVSLKRDGLFEEKPEPEPCSKPVADPAPVEDLDNLPRLPLGHQVPAAYKRETQATYTGIDPDTGRERTYTQVEVDNMPADVFKRTFSVPTTRLGRFTFDRR